MPNSSTPNSSLPNSSLPTRRDAACRVSACATNIGRGNWEAIQTRFSFSDESEEVILEVD
jgi:hypothetical protein